MRKDQQLKNATEVKEQLARDAAKLEQLWAGYDEGDDWKPVYSNRYEVPAPEALDTTKYNPHKAVDIETFVKHPHFLGLNPYPWQLLTLKLFYAGSEGNNNLVFNDVKKEEAVGCGDCVWSHIVENETLCAEQIEKGEPYQSILSPENSKCLECSRCPFKVRETRLNHEIEMSTKKVIENMLLSKLEDEPEDKFQSEMMLVDDIPDQAISLQIKKKLRNYFQELVLIMGRRSGKSFLVVAIALYELYKLLLIYHPQKKYRLPDFQEIHLLNVAKNEEQAKDSIFTPMKNQALSSPFFQKFIGVPNELEMKFRTEFDLDENKRRATKGIATLDGTIIMKCGSSSASGLVGKTCWSIIIDELAAMMGENTNTSLDKKLYDDLKPSLRTFGRDGKILCLSNPKGPFGQLFKLYNDRLEDDTSLVLKVPTWIMNANVDLDDLENERRKDPIEYNMQYGAEFGTNSQDPYLTPEDVDYAFDNSEQLQRRETRELGVEYYCHVDPSNRSDYYAISVVHSANTGNYDAFGKPIKMFFVDHIHFWAPVQMKQPVQSSAVEEYILKLHQKFQFKQISFDQWHSSEIMQSLASYGLPVVLKVFNKEYKDKIYIHLLEAFRDRKITFYRMSGGQVLDKKGKLISINEIPEAKCQFMFLQKKWRNGRQIIEALNGYKDDICDATAAAIFECSNQSVAVAALPKTRIAYTGVKFR